MKQRVWKKCKRLSSCSQRSRGGRKAQRGCLMSVWVTTSKSFVLPGSSVPRHPADEAPVTSCKCWLEARSTNEHERRIRGAERCWVLPTCREQPSHRSELGWFGTWAAESWPFLWHSSAVTQQREEKDSAFRNRQNTPASLLTGAALMQEHIHDKDFRDKELPVKTLHPWRMPSLFFCQIFLACRTSCLFSQAFWRVGHLRTRRKNQ